VNSSHPWGRTAAIAVVVGMFNVIIKLMQITVQTMVTAAGINHAFLWKAG